MESTHAAFDLASNASQVRIIRGEIYDLSRHPVSTEVNVQNLAHTRDIGSDKCIGKVHVDTVAPLASRDRANDEVAMHEGCAFRCGGLRCVDLQRHEFATHSFGLPFHEGIAADEIALIKSHESSKPGFERVEFGNDF